MLLTANHIFSTVRSCGNTEGDFPSPFWKHHCSAHIWLNTPFTFTVRCYKLCCIISSLLHHDLWQRFMCSILIPCVFNPSRSCGGCTPAAVRSPQHLITVDLWLCTVGHTHRIILSRGRNNALWIYPGLRIQSWLTACNWLKCLRATFLQCGHPLLFRSEGKRQQGGWRCWGQSRSGTTG